MRMSLPFAHDVETEPIAMWHFKAFKNIVYDINL